MPPFIGQAQIRPQNKLLELADLNQAFTGMRQASDRKIQYDDQQQQVARQNTIQDKQLKQGDQMHDARMQQLQSERVKSMAGLAQRARGNPQNWQNFLAADPEVAKRIPENIRSDPVAGADFIIGITQGYQDPMAKQQAQASLDLTRAQIDRARATDPGYKDIVVDGRIVRTTGDGASEIYSTPAEKAAGQFKDAKQTADVEGSLRKEFTAMNKTFRDVQAAYGRVQTSAKADNGAGDVALIFNYMKMLDPGSVVREGEFATAEQTSGVPTQVLNYYNKLVSGERLAPSQREQFVSLADQLYKREAGTYQKLRSQFEPIVTSKGLDPSAVMLDFTQPQAQPPPGQEDQQTQAQPGIKNRGSMQPGSYIYDDVTGELRPK